MLLRRGISLGALDSIVIAVLDDGFDLNHPDFQGDGKIVFPKDYIDGDSNPFPVTEFDYHGTPCAGVAVAESNGVGVVGIAHGCSFMPVRFPLKATDNQLIEIFEDVGRSAHVISCSWGPPPVLAPLNQAVYDTLETIATEGGPNGKGCVICFAANNFDAPINDAFMWLEGGSILRNTTGPILNGFALIRK